MGDTKRKLMTAANIIAQVNALGMGMGMGGYRGTMQTHHPVDPSRFRLKRGVKEETRIKIGNWGRKKRLRYIELCEKGYSEEESFDIVENKGGKEDGEESTNSKV